MAGLQRSVETFRRSGSSGLVWEERFEEIGQGKKKDGDAEAKEPNTRAAAGAGHTAYRTGNISPDLDPPSPKVSVCGFCGIFGKAEKNPPKPARR